VLREYRMIGGQSERVELARVTTRAVWSDAVAGDPGPGCYVGRGSNGPARWADPVPTLRAGVPDVTDVIQRSSSPSNGTSNYYRS